MTITNALNLFQKLAEQTTNKTESKVYKGFITVLTSLQNRQFSEEDLMAIEQKLDTLNLASNPSNKRKYYSAKYNEFTTFLNKTFSLVTEGHYMRTGMIYGMIFGPGLGLTFGTIFGPIGISIGLSIGMGMGMAMGIAFGSVKDAEAKKQGNVLV